MVREQLLNMLPEDVWLWVYERKPKTSAEAGALAEDYMQAREHSISKSSQLGETNPRVSVRHAARTSTGLPTAQIPGQGVMDQDQLGTTNQVSLRGLSASTAVRRTTSPQAVHRRLFTATRDESRDGESRTYRRETNNGVYSSS
jgi:hypothetical protein